MGTITEIKAQKRNKNRVSIYVDGQFLTGMQSIVALKNGLKTGAVIDEKDILQCVHESECTEAFDKCIALLSRGLKTRREIQNYLKNKSFTDGVIADTLDKLISYGYLDDGKYVDTYISVYKNARGINRLRVDLLNKGIDKNVLDEKLSALTDQTDAAQAAAEKYKRSHKDCDIVKLRRYLYSKGFTYSVIYEVTGEDADD